MHRLLVPLSLVVLLALALPLRSAAASPIHSDLEIDPTAYALSGNSLHVGIGYGRFRLDLGNFGIAIPQFLHGDDGFDLSMDGYGAKLQWFPFAEQRGLFGGVGASVTRILAERQGTDLAARYDQFGAGAHIGYRIELPASFYVTPWIGVDYEFGARTITLAGKTHDPSPVTVFPAIHVGYRFR